MYNTVPPFWRSQALLKGKHVCVFLCFCPQEKLGDQFELNLILKQLSTTKENGFTVSILYYELRTQTFETATNSSNQTKGRTTVTRKVSVGGTTVIGTD